MTADVKVDVRGLLFDMDGVLVDSTRCIWRAWSEWASGHGLDAHATFSIGHGLTTVDHVRRVAPHVDVEQAADRIEALEAHYADHVMAINGAARLTSSLPSHRWAVVTSCTRAGAYPRLQGGGITAPDVLICADDVSEGKPSAEGYLKAAELLGFDPSEVVVIEDAPTGITAADRAGMRALAVRTTHRAEELARATWSVPDLRDLTVDTRSDSGLTLRVPVDKV